MNTELFLIIYLFLIIIMVICEVRILSNGGRYLRISYTSLKSICVKYCNKEEDFDSKDFSHEISRLYNQCIQEMPQMKKLYPNIVIWLDAVIFKIDSGNKNASILKWYICNLKVARDILELENPFNKCEKYQQGILRDLEKVKTSENEILVQHIINKTEEEFLRLSGDIKKNNRLNIVSIGIGVVGIVVSILMAIIKF